MRSKPSIAQPAIGSLIDNDTLKLVEVIGYGGYGVVYRAIPTSARSFSTTPVFYAVKCLVPSQSSRKRKLRNREMTLHRLASAHRGVVTLHRVIEDADYTYFVMEYCPDGDLFSQILRHRRYLGYEALIKHVFLQLLDAVDHCHSLGIYHRNLKPETILCYDDGLRVGITNFDLATTDKVCQEFCTGSAYHLSPECQGGRFAPDGVYYSPLFSDVWSLGIILLNLVTGRNPWRSASLSDSTFYAYLCNPDTFLPTVLPISQEVNAILVKVFEVDWRKRITLKELRREIRAINNFYSDDAVFEASTARCSRYVVADVGSDSEDSEVQPPEPTTDIADSRVDYIPTNVAAAINSLAQSSFSGRQNQQPTERQPRPALDVIITDSGEDADGDDEDDAKIVVDARHSPVACGTIATPPSYVSSAHQCAINVELMADRSASGSGAGSAPDSPTVVYPRFDRGDRSGHMLSLLSRTNPALTPVISTPLSTISMGSVRHQEQNRNPGVHSRQIPSISRDHHLAISNSDLDALAELWQVSKANIDRGVLSALDLHFAKTLINDLQRILDETRSTRSQSYIKSDLKAFRRRAIRLLIKLTRFYGILPDDLFLDGVKCSGKLDPVMHGGFADIFEGRIGSTSVALKRLRVYVNAAEQKRIFESVFREATLWRQLDHPHILQFLGVDRYSFTPLYALVSPWMDCGNLLDYIGRIKAQPVRIHQLLTEAAKGLVYLHDQQIVHGDVRGVNILVNDGQQACLADFGLSLMSVVTSNIISTISLSNARWLAPELLQDDDAQASAPSDIYALGRVCLEAYTLKIPWWYIANESKLIAKITRGEELRRPGHEECGGRLLVDQVWAIMQQCWSRTPSSRPSASTFIELLSPFAGDHLPVHVHKS